MKRKNSWLFPTIAGIALLGLCLWLTGLPDPAALAQFSLAWVAVAALAQGGFALPMPWRWKLVSAGAKVFIPYLPAFKITAYASLAAAVVPQSVADLAGRGPWQAAYAGCGLLNAANIILCDRLLDVYVLGLLLPPALLLAAKLVDLASACWLAGAALLFGFALLLGLSKRFFMLFEYLFRGLRWACERTGFLKGKFNWSVSPIALSRGDLSLVYILSVFKFFVTAFASVAYFRAVGVDAPFLLVFFAAPVVQIVFIFAFTPGGLGIFELGWAGILGLHGVGAENIALFVVSQRLCFTLGVAAWALVAFAMRGVKLSPPDPGGASGGGVKRPRA